MKWQRSVAMYGLPAFILWLGYDAIAKINERYDGLCQMQGPGMKRLLFEDNPLGYCTGIGGYTGALGAIVAVAAFSVFIAIGLWGRQRGDD